MKTFGVCLGTLLALGAGCLGCLDPGTNKNSCVVPSDCLAGFVCEQGLCVAGTVDSGRIDAGHSSEFDAGEFLDGGHPGGDTDAGGDAGSTDAGSTDAGSADAGSTDAGATDAGVGATDSGVADAGSVDASVADAGTTDAGVDAGLPSVLVSIAFVQLADGGYETQLRHVDPATGGSELIRVLDGAPQYVSEPHADWGQALVTFSGSLPGENVYRLFRIDARTGVTLSAPVLWPDGTTFTMSAGVFPLNDGGLVGITSEGSPNDGGVETVRIIDGLTGGSTWLARIDGFDITHGQSAHDMVRDRIYTVAETIGDASKLFTLDSHTGAVLSSPHVPANLMNTTWAWLGVAADGGVVGLAYRNGVEELHRVEPSTAAFTVINTIPSVESLYGAYAYDRVQNRACFVSSAPGDARHRMTCVDVETGALLGNPVLAQFDGGTTSYSTLFFIAP